MADRSEKILRIKGLSAHFEKLRDIQLIIDDEKYIISVI